MFRLIVLIPLIAFAALAAYLAVGLTHDPRVLPTALLDKPAPAFVLPPLREGGPGLAKADLEGQVSLVNVFASWCVPCRAEHPLLMRLAQEKIVPIYGINWKDKREDATAWLDRLGNPYSRIGYDGDGRVGIDWGVYGVPETYIIDRQGRIRHRHVGPLVPETLEKEILPKIRELQE